MCPSREAIADPSWIAPITSRMTGKVCSKRSQPPCTSCNRYNTPMVISTAGPIRLLIIQLWQRHFAPLLISAPLSTASAQPVPQHKEADADQHYRPEDLPHTKIIEHSKIIQKKKRAKADENKWTGRLLVAPRCKGISHHLSCLSRADCAHGVDGHIKYESHQHENKYSL